MIFVGMGDGGDDNMDDDDDDVMMMRWKTKG